MGYQKLVQTGSIVETYEYSRDILHRRPRSHRRSTMYRRPKVRNRRADNILRLSRNFGRLVRANVRPGEDCVLLTATMFETVPLRSAYRSLSRFVQRLRRKFGKSFRYVGVPEFQSDLTYRGQVKDNGGAVHFHILFWGLPDSVLLNEGSWINVKTNGEKYSRWLQRKGKTVSELSCTRDLQRLWGRGFVDVVPADNSPKLSHYLSKYMSKTMQDSRLFQQKAYCASRNALRSVSVGSSAAFQYLELIVGDSVPIKVKSFDTQWLGECKYCLYDLSDNSAHAT